MKIATTSQASKGVVAVVAAMSSFLMPFTGSSVNIALPSLGTELALDAVALSWVATVYLLAAAVFLVPFGRIADIYGRKRIYQIGIVIDVVASVLCALSSSGAWLIFFRALQGLGGAMIFGTAVAILTSVFPANERGKAIGTNAAAVYIGLSVGPIAGGFLTAYFGWRSIFLLNAFLGLIITVIVFWKLKGEWRGASGEKLDYVGSIVYSLALVCLMYAFSVFPSLWGIWLVVAGLIGFAVFVRWETKQEHPVLDIGLFRRNTVFAFSNLAALASYCATFAVIFLLSLYLQYIKGFTPEHAGLILLAQPVMMAICSPIAGSLSDRIQPRIIASAAMAETTLGLVLLIFLDSSTGLTYILITLIILGSGFGLFSSPNTNAVMSSVERRFYGVAAGTISTMRLIGQTLSMGLALLLFAVYIGRAQITPEYYPLFLKSMKTAFIIFAALCFAGIFASIARGETRPK